MLLRKKKKKKNMNVITCKIERFAEYERKGQQNMASKD